MSRRTLLIPPLCLADGTPVAATLTAVLVDARDRPLVGFTDSVGLIDTLTVRVSSTGATLEVTPQSEIRGRSWWRLTFATTTQQARYRVQVPAGETPIPLVDLLTLADPVDPTDPISERLLPLPDSLADGLVLAIRDGAWVLTDTPSGAGIPDAPLTDGPYGRQSGAWVTVAAPLTVLATTSISGHRAIAADADGQAIYADQADETALAVLGLSAQAATTGDPLIVVAQGPLDWPAGGLTPDAPLFLGAAGTLTHTAPTSGWVRQIAQAVDTDRLIISIGPAYRAG